MSFPGASSFYARWRQAQHPGGLQDSGSGGPPEKLLQTIWQQQCLDRARLRLTDGRRLRVLHPGFWNHEAGPDFRRAVVQFDDAPPLSGDVEIDLHPGCWRGHRHHVNPAYAAVILHVVWETGSHPTGGLPALCLRDFLDAPLEELANWLSAESVPEPPAEQAGRCAEAWRALSAAQREALLHQAALVRLQGKAIQMQRRARAVGWAQALWESVFRALGYKHNTWPMQNLGELCPRLAEGAADALHWQARLLGAGGLLPADLERRPAGHVFARRLWDVWWRDRDVFGDCLLPPRLWRLGGLRPANHPQRRLALAAHWLAEGRLPERLEKWFRAEIASPQLAASLLETLAVKDEYWDWHWSLRTARLDTRQTLLGAPRTTDLAVNVILPWLWLRAVEGRSEAARQRAENRYFAWPPGEDNTVLKLARQRMLGGLSESRLKSAAAQQGLLQIVRDCCDHANSLCQPCVFPELVRQFAVEAGP